MILHCNELFTSLDRYNNRSMVWTLGFSLSLFKLQRHRRIAVLFCLCDVICENLSNGGTNSVILDQLFYHVCNRNQKRQKYSFKLFMSDKKCRLLSDAVQNARRLIKAWTFCSSIRHVFEDEVMYGEAMSCRCSKRSYSTQ